MTEIWKDLPKYEGRYKISNTGKVIGPSGKLLSPSIVNGYYKVVLYDKNCNTKFIGVHRLVALTFIPNPDNLPQVNHKDENKLNNNCENLEWCSAAYNNTYGTRLKRAIEHGHLASSITQGAPIKCIENNTIYYSIREAARQLNIHHTGIMKVLRGDYSSTGGYHFKYVVKGDIDNEQS